MTSKEQEKLWVEGTSVHNNDAAGEGGECCPDFSCCKPDLKWPQEKRIRFSIADEPTRYQMLLGSLAALMDYEEIRRVHIAGLSKKQLP